jgi:hypothetical protein
MRDFTSQKNIKGNIGGGHTEEILGRRRPVFLVRQPALGSLNTLQNQGPTRQVFREIFLGTPGSARMS